MYRSALQAPVLAAEGLSSFSWMLSEEFPHQIRC
jgi:hypothetical protein